ncbi:RNase A-like domain-containing protein [Paraburkholderia sp. JPY419]|uniref:RNase A-like domain-containing protein n=1 Tax=Paraburkholderia sp. JPY419 TaxID=667660 RepID=UPI003D19D952
MSYQQDSGAVRVVFSAPQLAAVLSRQSINPTEMLSNRLWGGLQVVGGVLEMVGAAALCVLPEPTMASKTGCVVFGAHGSDTVSAGVRQIWTGRDTATLIQQGTTKLAEAMKASPDMANIIGLSVDMIVPFGFAGSIKAARVASVTMGRINLQMHEARAVNPGLGGHTILKHVEKDEAWLRERLKRDLHIAAASSFADIRQAEWAITEAMRVNATKIKAWTRAPRNDLTLFEDVGRNVGNVVSRKSGEYRPASRVKVILRYQTYNGMPYYVLTAMLVA